MEDKGMTAVRKDTVCSLGTCICNAESRVKGKTTKIESDGDFEDSTRT